MCGIRTFQKSDNNFPNPRLNKTTRDFQVFFSDFWNVLIPPILFLPSITSRIHYFQKQHLEQPRYFFLTWDLQVFFLDFWNVLIPPILILPSITSRIHYFQKKNLGITRYLFLNLGFARFYSWFSEFVWFRQSWFYTPPNPSIYTNCLFGLKLSSRCVSLQ